MNSEHEMLIAKKYGIARSPKWPAYARAWTKAHPKCLVCGRSDLKRNVHHKIPFHFVVSLGRPDLELDPRNAGFTLCVEHSEEHHLLVGHLDSFESYNPALEHFLALSRGLTADQIRAMPLWIEAEKSRPKTLGQMTGADKRALQKLMDKLMPLKVVA